MRNEPHNIKFAYIQYMRTIIVSQYQKHAISQRAVFEWRLRLNQCANRKFETRSRFVEFLRNHTYMVYVTYTHTNENYVLLFGSTLFIYEKFGARSRPTSWYGNVRLKFNGKARDINEPKELRAGKIRIFSFSPSRREIWIWPAVTNDKRRNSGRTCVCSFGSGAKSVIYTTRLWNDVKYSPKLALYAFVFHFILFILRVYFFTLLICGDGFVLRSAAYVHCFSQKENSHEDG